MKPFPGKNEVRIVPVSDSGIVLMDSYAEAGIPVAAFERVNVQDENGKARPVVSLIVRFVKAPLEDSVDKPADPAIEKVREAVTAGRAGKKPKGPKAEPPAETLQ